MLNLWLQPQHLCKQLPFRIRKSYISRDNRITESFHFLDFQFCPIRLYEKVENSIKVPQFEPILC